MTDTETEPDRDEICGVCGDLIDSHTPADDCGRDEDRRAFKDPVLAAVIERTATLVEDYLDGRTKIADLDAVEVARQLSDEEREEADRLERIAEAAERDEPDTPRERAAPTPLDLINHPPHYTSHPSGVECIEVVEHFGFSVGNAIKYLWRAGLKDGADALDDLSKAAWYVSREIDRRTLLAEQAGER